MLQSAPAPSSISRERNIDLVIFDVDGVLWCNNKIHPSANSVLQHLRTAGVTIAFLSNDAANSSCARFLKLAKEGLDVCPDATFTGLTLASEYLKRTGNPRTLFLGSEAMLLSEYPQAHLVDTTPAEVVLVGDYFDHFGFEKLNVAFTALNYGAKLVAIQKNRCWSSSVAPRIDVGFWTAGLEYCAQIKAEIVGKPSAFAFRMVMEKFQISPHRVVMVGDSIEHDLLPAKELGLLTVFASEFARADNHALLHVPDCCIRNLEDIVPAIVTNRSAHRS